MKLVKHASAYRLVRQVEVLHPVGTAAKRRAFARIVAKGFLWRALVGLTLIPAVLIIAYGGSPASSSTDEARMLVRRYAFEAFPQWAQHEHMEICPQTLDDLSPIIGRADSFDPWGTPLELHCGPHVRGALVRSAGPDGKFGTTDDIDSQQ